MPTSSVLIVGAGPTGLALAAELAELGVSCRVLERRREPSSLSRAFSLMPRTLELMDMRGCADRFVTEGLPYRFAPLGDGRQRSLDYGLLRGGYPYILVMPQSKIEEILEKRAVAAGAEILRGAAVTGLAQDADGVQIQVETDEGERTESADYLVGCDGVRSTVRDLLGVRFVGRSYRESVIVADVRMDRPPRPPVYGRAGRRGSVAIFPYGNGVFRLIVLDHARMGIAPQVPITRAELEESLEAIAGVDFGLHDPVWASRFRSDQRQSARYRVGRVFLAGDAAHTHIPSGGQGLQMGIHDAANLAWKLAAELSGWAQPWLLGSYERERRSIAEETLRKTDLVFRFETSRSAAARGARWLGTQLMGISALQPLVIEQFAGMTQRYPRGKGEHRLTGARIPDLTLQDYDGATHTVFQLLRRRRFVLLDQTASGRCAERVRSGWGGRVVAVNALASGGVRLAETVLIRPDGYIGWAGPGDPRRLLREVTRWCGPADAGG
ncbi:FAD-dependent monooxygenase [Marinactinospora thermotolerans]|uniref:2-polyprenyl-6-methoxyphenol hydroxylase n=1 Tax=Marinactinospora thermotolerans DSM 45154 TaxID=1122192 RepID=A0A1T4KIL0_9ACTN|nr:FAD-dependent monooxygenase [Marinactinospora thermotolerans]SJZ42248.1 2-polyprenyl-6-methoxyphenol hydroxylase [Marinactinospora thermotolerans DSM 45154]